MRTGIWTTKPTPLITIPNEVDYLLMIDESGQSSNFNKIIHKVRNNIDLTDSEKVLCLTGVIISRNEFITKLKPGINNLKNKYWVDGNWYNPKVNRIERVHFHSVDLRNINNKRNAIRLLNDDAYTNFINDLSNLIDNLEFKVISICIDNTKLCNKYKNPMDNYDYATKLLLERFVIFLRKKVKTGTVIFESRQKQDKRQLSIVLDLLNNGDEYISEDYNGFGRIHSVYFCPKIPPQNPLHSYVGIELVDIVTYPIYKYFLSTLNGTTYSGRDWKMVEKKLDNYPNYFKYGLKFIP